MESNQHNDDFIQQRSTIQKFYSEKSIFITGGFGFLGKILIEKLLRSCPEIYRIYLLVRSKKNQSPENRLNELFQMSLYDRVREEIPNFRNKIIPLVGDLNFEYLGMSENDKTLLINNVSIIFHVAATVRFNEKLEDAVRVNINGTEYILNLAKRMQNLKSFIHVSTLYVHPYKNIIEERCYTTSIDYKVLIKNLSRNITDEATIRIFSQWPNTYTFTKALAEELLKNEGTGLPIGIFRPSIVTPCINEPYIGWIDNHMGVIGLTIGYLNGLIKFLPCNGNSRVNFVPADFTINGVIASAWDVHNRSNRKDILVYNFGAPADAPTYKKFTQELYRQYEIKPINNIFCLPSLIFVSHIILFKICTWFIYFPIILLLDAVYVCCWNERPRLWILSKKMYKFIDVLSYFMDSKWIATNKNIQEMWNSLSERDQQIFKFNWKKFDWIYYFAVMYKGIRLHLIKEDDSVLERAHNKKKRFLWIQRNLLIFFIFIIFFLVIWNVVL